MNRNFKRTKVIATVGPALTQKLFTWEAFNDPANESKVKLAYKMIEDAMSRGANVFRLNFSHGTYDEQAIRIKIIREVAKKTGKNVSIMLDTKGPEIRVRAMSDDAGVQVKAGTEVTVHALKNVLGTPSAFAVTDSTGKYNMAKDVKVGSYILVDDGKLRLRVKKVAITAGTITTEAENSHLLKANKRINLPGTAYSMPFLSDKDEHDIAFACQNDLDCIAASFVNTAKNVKQIRAITKKAGKPHMHICSKIESTQAIDHIEAIINESDSIMVARGDLGLEIPYYEVPHWEKYLIKACRYVGKPVIVATQMLDSLERSPSPTRAEVTDVFFAVERGADATMLSGETAQGLFPLEAIEVMSTIDTESEMLFDYDRALNVYFPKNPLADTDAGRLAARIAAEIAPEREMVDANFKLEYLVVPTNDREMVAALSSVRMPATVVVVTDDPTMVNAFGLHYGIQTHLVPSLNDLDLPATAAEAVKIFPKGRTSYLHKNKLVDLG